MAVTRTKTAPAKSKFARKLAAMKGAWKKAEAKGGAAISVGDGTYEAVLKDAELIESSAGELLVKWTVEVVKTLGGKGDEEAAGEVFSWNSQTKTDENLGYLKGDLAKFDVAIDDITDLEEALETIKAGEPVLRVSVRTNATSGFTNAYINRVEGATGDVGDGDDDGDGKASDAEDTPEIEKGSEVEYTPPGKGKKAIACTVLRIGKDGLLLLKGPRGEKFADVDVDECELTDTGEGDEADADAGDEDDVAEGELVKGSKVEVTLGKKSHEGTVVSVDEADETAKVRINATKKVVEVSIEQLALLEE